MAAFNAYAMQISPRGDLIFHDRRKASSRYFPQFMAFPRKYHVHDTVPTLNAFHVFHATQKLNCWSVKHIPVKRMAGLLSIEGEIGEPRGGYGIKAVRGNFIRFYTHRCYIGMYADYGLAIVM
jgi:hypothetical protein